MYNTRTVRKERNKKHYKKKNVVPQTQPMHRLVFKAIECKIINIREANYTTPDLRIGLRSEVEVQGGRKSNSCIINKLFENGGCAVYSAITQAKYKSNGSIRMWVFVNFHQTPSDMPSVPKYGQ